MRSGSEWMRAGKSRLGLSPTAAETRGVFGRAASLLAVRLALQILGSKWPFLLLPTWALLWVLRIELIFAYPPAAVQKARQTRGQVRVRQD